MGPVAVAGVTLTVAGMVPAQPGKLKPAHRMPLLRPLLAPDQLMLNFPLYGRDDPLIQCHAIPDA